MANRLTYVKVLPPRQLVDTETTHSLTQWKINFKQYCKRDDNYRHFLLATTTWNAAVENYGFANNVGNRTPEMLKEDVQDFLLMLASYLPHGYITDKILKKSRSFDSAFTIVEEHYGLTPSQETFCDFASMLRLPNEPYRQFYDRMVAFISKHLMKRNGRQNVEVDGIFVPDNGDDLSVSMLNLVAIQWINKIHPELLTIVRTEYAKDLRDDTPIASLVPRISLSIDALLSKYDKLPSVAEISTEARNQCATIESSVLKVSAGQAHTKRSQNQKKMFCPGCFYFGNKVSAQLYYKHAMLLYGN